MVTKEEYEQALEVICKYRNQLHAEYIQVNEIIQKSESVINAHSFVNKLYNQGHISVRLYKLIAYYFRLQSIKVDSVTLIDVSSVPLPEWSKIRNFGKITAVELNNLLESVGLWSGVNPNT